MVALHIHFQFLTDLIAGTDSLNLLEIGRTANRLFLHRLLPDQANQPDRNNDQSSDQDWRQRPFKNAGKDIHQTVGKAAEESEQAFRVEIECLQEPADKQRGNQEL